MELSIAALELEILTDFLDEALEHLEGIEEKILQLESAEDLEMVNSIFRPIHTIKGTASFLGLNDVKYLSHELETLLDDLRKKLISVSGELIDVLLDGIDTLAKMLAEVQNGMDNADNSTDPVTLLILDLYFADKIEDINELKHSGAATDEQQQDTVPPAGEMLTREELLSITYPMEMDLAFVEESREHLEELEQSFLALESSPDNLDLINDLFRGLHSIKGSAGVLVSTVESEEYRRKHPLTVFQTLAHAAEGMIQGARDSQTALKPEMIETLLLVVDRLGAMLTGFVETTPVPQDDELLDACNGRTQTIVQHDTSGISGQPAPVQRKNDAGVKFALANTLSQSLAATEAGLNDLTDANKQGAALSKIVRSLTMIIKVCNKADLDVHADNADSVLSLVNLLREGEKEGEESFLIVIGEAFASLQQPLLEYLEVGCSPPASPPQSTRTEKQDKTLPPVATHKIASVIKVPQERLDILMNLVGELIISKSSFPEIAREITVDHDLNDLGKRVKGAGDHVGRITDELQNIVMQMRMLPVGSVFSKFKRLVRDLSKKLDKKIALKFSGEETELDKTIIETLGDPMVHLIRNCADHALEGVAERQSVGKSDEGTILLKAYNQGQNVIIEIIDDGRGIDPQNIRVKAVEKGYLSLEELEKLDDQEVQNLIFRAGFSGAKEVSEVSGRGVGMDVVRTNVEQIGGTVSLSSTAGVGTTITITLPLTLAVSKGLEVKAAKHHYYLPLDYIIETVKIPPSLVRRHKDQQMVVIRKDLLPVFSLAALLDSSFIPANINTDNLELSLVVLNMNGKKAALIVDCFYTENEFVIKPLTGSLAKIPGLSGATITSSGKVILILDPLKLF